MNEPDTFDDEKWNDMMKLSIAEHLVMVIDFSMHSTLTDPEYY